MKLCRREGDRGQSSVVSFSLQPPVYRENTFIIPSEYNRAHELAGMGGGSHSNCLVGWLQPRAGEDDPGGARAAACSLYRRARSNPGAERDAAADRQSPTDPGD